MPLGCRLSGTLSTRIASMLFACCFEASNYPIFHSRPVCYLYVLPICYLHATSKLRTTQSSILGQYAIYMYCHHVLLRNFELPNLPFSASMLSICIASMLFTCWFEASNYPIFHSRPVCYLYVLPSCATSKLQTTQSSILGQYVIYMYCQYAIYMLLRSFELPNLPFSASMLSICIAIMCYFETSNYPIFHSRPVCYLYVLPACYLHAGSKLRTTQFSILGQYAIYMYCHHAIYMLVRSFELPNFPFSASMLSICTANMLFTCYFEASNYPIFHSRPVCYLYVLPSCATSKLRTTQSSILGQYAIYMYCQHAIYMLVRSFELPNFPFSASMLSICIAIMCYFETSNYPIFHSRPVCYLYVLPSCYLHAGSKLRTTQFSILGQYVIYMYCQYAIYMLLRSFELPNLPFSASMLSICIAIMCYFETSNYPIFHSRPVCYLYVLPACYLHAGSKLRTTQFSILGQYAIYMYCQHAIYMLVRSFELPNLSFPARMLSICIAIMCYFETSNYPIFHSRPVCYLYVLPSCATSKLRTTQSSILGQYAIYMYCHHAIYMLLRSFELRNLSFPASMLSICIAIMCYFETSNYPIFHSRPVCYLYVLPACYLHAGSKLRTTQSFIPGQYAIYMYCQHAIYMLLRSFELPNLSFPASMLSICIAIMLFTCYFEASNYPIFHSRPVCYLYVLPSCYLHAASKLRTTQSFIPGQYAIYMYCHHAIYMLLRSFELPNLSFPASMLSICIAIMLFTCCFEASNYPIFHSQPVCYLYVLPSCATSKLRTTQSSILGQYAIYMYCQYAIYMLVRSFELPNLPFPASMLSICIAIMLFTCYFEALNYPIFHSRPVCYLYVLPSCATSKLRTTQSSILGQYAIYMYCQHAIYMLVRSFELPNFPFSASMLSICTASMLFTCCFEASNYPIFHSRPVCYLYVLPICYLHATSKLRTTQSFIPGQYAIYMYCQHAIYMLLRSFELPNLSFPASMLSICIASTLFTCWFEASNYPIFHSRPVCYLYVLPSCYLHATSKLRTTQSFIPGQHAIYMYCQYAVYMLVRSFELPNLPFSASMLSICIAIMLFTCCFEASNYPIFHSRPVCYLCVLPSCYLHAASKLRTTQSSIPGQYAIYMYCQHAIYMLVRSFELPNFPFPASMLSICIASMLFTCCFEASNYPIFHSRPVCYLYVLPVRCLHAGSKLRTTQSSILGQYAIYMYCHHAIYMLLRSFELPNLSFPASMLSICIASTLFTCWFEASNYPIFHSRPVCYLYVLPSCYLHAASKLRTTQSSIPGQYAIYVYCHHAIYMLLQSFELPNLPFPASMLSICIASMLYTCYFRASNHSILHSRPV